MINRVADYYETARKFLKLSVMGQLFLADHFKVLSISEWRLSSEEIAVKVFTKVLEKNRYTEFKSLVGNYKNDPDKH